MLLITIKKEGFAPTMPNFLLRHSLTWRMFVFAVPTIALSLMILFALTCNTIEGIVSEAIARNEQLHADSLVQVFERVLLEARNQLRILAAGSTDKESMKKRILLRKKNEVFPYREIAFASSVSDERYVLLAMNDTIVDLPRNIIKNTPLSPFQTINETDLATDAVSISTPIEVTYSMIPLEGKLDAATFHVIRLSKPIIEEDGSVSGVLTISLDLRIFRDILSKKSVDLAASDTSGKRTIAQSFFFDASGWILFQSEKTADDKDLANIPLRKDEVRAGFNGDHGSPWYKTAFRPSAEYDTYTEMVEAISQHKSGHSQLSKDDTGWSRGQAHAESVSYAPVSFFSRTGVEPKVIGGIALLDTNFSRSQALTFIYRIFLLCFLLSLLLVSIYLWDISRRTTRRLALINDQLTERNENESTKPLSLPKLPIELDPIRCQIDTLLLRLQRAETEHANRLAESNAKKLSEPVQDLPSPEEIEKERIVGTSEVICALRQQIATVARVSADVLVVGETGTGKELVSQAIHDASDRASKPFISINCGALDESLLMDTLFGHVKGAFTEAKQNRKGAFIAADGGTLMLDEIGNAAPKVQQALLRALSTRCIRPLGSDQEIPFSARIIAATNADLRSDGKDGSFRNDLYFRLAVISIQTPPLRERKDDIPALLVHFMHEAISQENGEPKRPMPAISKGALEKLQNYAWPGNVRELKNVITRAMAFSKKDILDADDILLDAQKKNASEPTPPKIALRDLKTNIQHVLSQLNPRQQAALPIIMQQGCITRQEYQEISQEPISMRTAQYDLQQMVQLGLITRKGRGPSMSYFVEGFEEHNNEA